jgi:hypothetical protein
MSNIDFLDSPQEEGWTWQQMLSPVVLTSIGLHGLLLLVPIQGSNSSHNKPPTPPPKEEKVKLTELPTGVLPPPAPASASPTASSTPQPTASPTATPTISPTVTATPTPSISPSRSPIPNFSPKAIPFDKLRATPSGSPKPSATPKPSDSPKSSATPKPSDSPKSSATPKPSDSPKPSATPKPSDSPQPSATPTPPPSPVAPFTDLRYPNAQPGAFDMKAIARAANQTPDGLDKVSSFFEREFQSRGYKATPDTGNTNRKIYEVTKDGVTKYITLFRNPSGTVIALSDARLPDDLGNTAVASKEELAFEAANAQLQKAARPIEASLIEDKLAAPTAFYADVDNGQAHPAIEGSVKLIAGQPADGIAGSLATTFAGFEITPKSAHGGGNLYQLTQGGFTRFISLIPAKDSSGTVVAVWTISPN